MTNVILRLEYLSPRPIPMLQADCDSLMHMIYNIIMMEKLIAQGLYNFPYGEST